MKIEILQNCTACYSCYSVCLQKSITLCENEEGFLFPKIDKKLCVKCGLCEKVCPILSPNTNINLQPQAFAVVNNNEQIRLESSSGGVFSAIAEKVITNSGIVFGAKFDADFSVVHDYTDNIAGLADFRGSKYVQSTIGDSFKNCKRLLDSGKQVLFTGTPCQIVGLKSFLQKDYPALITVDFICHGVPSVRLWEKYLASKSKKRKITKINFRDKTNGWKNYNMAFIYSDGKTSRQDFRNDSYMRLFLKNLCLRSSCYCCNFKKVNRCSDITLADFWGIQREFPELDDDKGISFVIAHSPKGQKIIENLNTCTIKEIDVNIGAKHNSTLTKSVALPVQRELFFKDLIADKLSVKQLADKYAAIPLLKRVKKMIKHCLKKILIRRKK